MRLSDKFTELKKREETALITYVSAGDPNIRATEDIVKALIEGGSDILEIGLPFSDPIADGPTIQRASERALKAGMNTDVYFSLCKRISSVYQNPIVCLTYYNLIYKYGIERFADKAESAGIKGIIVADLPVEEADSLLNTCKSRGIDLIFIVAPTTTEKRMKKILAATTGFVYIVSLLGVTGAREALSEYTKPLIERVKKETPLPACVGFGISKPEHVYEMRKAGADGVIIGSAIINIIEQNMDNRRNMCDELTRFVSMLKEGTRKKKVISSNML